MTARKHAHPERDGRAPTDATDPERADDLGAQPPSAHELQVQLDAARADALEKGEAARRWQAEFENFRRRQAAQAEDQVTHAGRRVVERLLPVMDDLERTIDHTIAGGDLGHLLDGVEMVQKQLVDVLGREGVEVIDPFGEAFDPHSHHAVSQREDPALPEHTVVEVFQKGYRMHGRVLRPAMVVVSHGGPEREAPAKE
jgi:molecular chaperone GrpE